MIGNVISNVTSNGSPLWPPDWSTFLPILTATSLGVFLALLAGLEVNRRLRKWQESREAEKLKHGATLLLQQMASDLSASKQLLERMKADLLAKHQIDYSINLDFWRGQSREVLEAIENPEVAHILMRAYDHLSEIDYALNEYENATRAGSENQVKARFLITHRLMTLIDEAINRIDIAYKKLENEIARISN